MKIKPIRHSVVFLILFCLIMNVDGSRQAWGLDSIQAAKFAPCILALAVIIWSIRQIRVNGFTFLAIALLLAMLIGSLISLIGGSAVSDTYLGRSLSMSFLVYGIMVSRFGVSSKDIFCRIYYPFLGFASVMAINCVFFYFGFYPLGVNVQNEVAQIYHAEIFLLFALPFLVWWRTRKDYLALISLLGVVVAALCTGKATSYLVAVLGVTFFAAYAIASKSHSVKNQVKVVIFMLMMVSVFAPVAILHNVIEERIDVEAEHSVRNVAIKARYQQFIESPVYGNFFTGDPTIDFGITHEIPSHLDYLDLLSAGGIVWFSLFMYLVVVAFLSSISKPLRYELSFFSALLVGGLAVMAVNPILALPRISFFVLFPLGYLVGMFQKTSKQKRLEKITVLARHIS